MMRDKAQLKAKKKKTGVLLYHKVNLISRLGLYYGLSTWLNTQA